MAGEPVECPRCGNQNAAAAAKCAHCGIDLAWAIEHWNEVVSGPQEPHAPLILLSEDCYDVLTLAGIVLNQAGYRVAKSNDSVKTLDMA